MEGALTNIKYTRMCRPVGSSFMSPISRTGYPFWPWNLGLDIHFAYLETCDFRCWEYPQTLPALFIGPFEHVERFRNLKFAVKRITTFRVLL